MPGIRWNSTSRGANLSREGRCSHRRIGDRSRLAPGARDFSCSSKRQLGALAGAHHTAAIRQFRHLIVKRTFAQRHKKTFCASSGAFMVNANGVSRGDRNRNARLARLRELVPLENAIVGIDLADKKQVVVVTDHDSKVLARHHIPV